MKTIISIAVITIICCSSFSNLLLENNKISSFATNYNDEDEYENYHYGVPPAEELDVERYSKFFENSSSKSEQKLKRDSTKKLESSCDLSTQKNFPKIGHQGGLASCTSWATTYYQFTYEAYKGTDIDLKSDKNNNFIYSPAWTFNFLNNGINRGAFISDAMEVLKEHGALKLADYPYSPLEIELTDINNFNFNLSKNTEAMISALNIRITDYGKITLSPDASENLNEIKQLLYGTDGTDGHVLTFSTKISGWRYKDGLNKESNSNESIAYCCIDILSGHSMTIVGYNDNIWCDINNNGVEDEGELGAFKVADSYGINRFNNGFIWVAYDALNAESNVVGSQKFETRIPIFQYEEGKSNLYWMEVGEKEVKYVGQLEIDTNYRNSLEIYAGKSNHELPIIEKRTEKFKSYYTDMTVNDEIIDLKKRLSSYQGTLVFDYDDLCEPISDYIEGYNWFVDVEGNHNSMSFKITDNLSNTVVDFGDISTGDSYKPINLSMRDLDYNGIVDVNDSKILFNSIYNNNNNNKLSNLQEYLASNMNKDFSVHAAITPSGYDDIGKVLDNLNAGNIAWDSVSSDVSLQTLIDGNYDVLFINCAEDVKTNGEVIKAFVEQGGTVYASDWALDALIEAFPERNITYTTENPQNIIANVIDKGLNTSTGLETVPVNFNLNDWRLINSALQDDVTTYISGSVEESGNKEVPLAFSFSYGDNGGKVFYTSFHHEANMTDEMQDVLNDLILIINHNKDINILDEWIQVNQYYSVMHNVGVVEANELSKSYVLDKLENSTEFVVITDETGNFSIELTAPNGNIYTNYKNGEFLSGLISDSSDSVQVYSLGKRGLRISNPSILSNEDNHWSYRVISHLPYRSSFVVGVAEKNEKAVLDYIIDYKVTQDWGNGQNVEVTITNIGDAPIRNWALQCDNFFGTVSNVWNGKLQGDNIIRNDIHNSDIASGSSITMGYILTNATGEVPEFTLCSFRNAKNNGYSVDFDILSDWGEGFIGNITITNTTDTPIMAWELNFIAENFIIYATSQFEIIKNVENNYTITGTYNGNIPIPAYSSVTLQFNGKKTGIPSISDISMTEMIIQE